MDLCSFSCSPELPQIKKTLFNEGYSYGRYFIMFLEVRYILCLEGIGRDYSRSMVVLNSQISLVILY